MVIDFYKERDMRFAMKSIAEVTIMAVAKNETCGSKEWSRWGEQQGLDCGNGRRDLRTY